MTGVSSPLHALQRDMRSDGCTSIARSSHSAEKDAAMSASSTQYKTPVCLRASVFANQGSGPSSRAMFPTRFC